MKCDSEVYSFRFSHSEENKYRNGLLLLPIGILWKKAISMLHGATNG